MYNPNIKAPSRSIQAKNKESSEDAISHNRKSNAIILILSGIIICLVLIMMSLILAPSSKTESKPKAQIKSQTTAISQSSDTITPSPTSSDSALEQNISTAESLEDNNVKVKFEEKLNFEKNIIIDKKETIEKEIIEQGKESPIEMKEETLDMNFNDKVSEILETLEKKQYSQAGKKLNELNKNKDDDAIIEDLERRINSGLKAEKINRLIRISGNEEDKENWKSALNYYNKIINIDANINRILVKKQRALSYIKLNQILDNIINKPERLQNDKVLESSKNSLQFVKLEMNNKQGLLYPLKLTPKLNDKIIKTEKIIEQASLYINVTIESDNLTDIVIYKIGQFGKLKEKKISLRPGLYTIVGSREGYRDFRKKLEIKASDSFIVIRVECREAI